MKFLADESVDKPIIQRLRKAGFTVKAIVEIDPGIPDDKVINIALEEQSILITSDKDFGRLVVRRGRLTNGVILLRLSSLTPQRSAEIVTSAIKQHKEKISRNFCVITHSSVRIRHLSI